MARRRYHVPDGDGIYWWEDVRAHGCLPVLALLAVGVVAALTRIMMAALA